MAAAMSPSLIMRSEAPTRADFFDDLLVPRPVEHHHDDVLHAFVQRARHDGERFRESGSRISECRSPRSCMYWMTRGP